MNDIILIVLFFCLCLNSDVGKLALENPHKILYKSFYKDLYNLYAWKGKKIKILTQDSDLNPLIMYKILQTFDDCYNYHSTITNHKPKSQYLNDSLLIIAEVDYTCGIACGYLGVAGIEISSKQFQILYEEIKRKDIYDQTLFYEFGRNFWFYEKKLTFKNSPLSEAFRTGFAVFMRYMVINSLRLKGADLNGFSYNVYEKETKKLICHITKQTNTHINYILDDQDIYLNKNTYKFKNTDLIASILYYLYELDGFGDIYLKNLWHELQFCPDALSDQDIIDNFFLASCNAVSLNLSTYFEQNLKIFISTEVISKVNHLPKLNINQNYKASIFLDSE